MTDNSRKTAVLALCGVHKGGWTNLTAKKALAAASLSPRDKAFAGALFYGSVERLVTLDWLLKPFLKKPVEKLDVEVRSILETAVYQLMYMSVPASAAVNEAVKLTRKLGKSSAAGMVNAVLRKAALLPKNDDGPVFEAFEDELSRVCVVYSLSPQVAKEIMTFIPDKYDEYLQNSFSGAGFSIAVNTLKTTAEELRKALEGKGAELTASPDESFFFCNMPGGVASEELFNKGHYSVQGAASYIACICLEAENGDRVLDLCAAPGGKAAAAYIRAKGQIELTACDIHPHRVKLIEENFARLGIDGVRLIENDACVYNEELEGQDKILCDVPCSGLGTLAGKPDIRYSGDENFQELSLIQSKVLATAARYIKKGGRITYSTCTIRRQENHDIIKEFLKNNPGFRLVSPAYVPAGAVVESNMMTILPNNTKKPFIDGEFVIRDGFFVATLERM